MSRTDADIRPDSIHEDDTLESRVDALLGELELAAAELDDAPDDGSALGEARFDDQLRQLDRAIETAIRDVTDRDRSLSLDDSIDDSDAEALLEAEIAAIPALDIEDPSDETTTLDEALDALDAEQQDPELDAPLSSASSETVPDSIDELDAQLAEAALLGDDISPELSAPAPTDEVIDTDQGATSIEDFETGDAIAESIAEDLGTPIEAEGEAAHAPEIEAGAESAAPEALASDTEAPAETALAPEPAPEPEASEGEAGAAATEPEPARSTPGTKRGSKGPKVSVRTLGLRVASCASLPMMLIPPGARAYVGYFGLISVFNGVFIWLALMMRG